MDKQTLREQLLAEVALFTSTGGTITVCPPQRKKTKSVCRGKTKTKGSALASVCPNPVTSWWSNIERAGNKF